MKLLVLDNYDSFTYNLVHLIEKVSDISFDVIKNDGISVQDIDQYTKIMLSPGPGLPSQAGIMSALLERYHKTKSIFGVCLGFQAIGETFGCSLKNLETVVHGMATEITLTNDDPIFKNCPPKFKTGRYHSWVIDEHKINSELIVTAVDQKNVIMAAKHSQYDVRGVQFHPESILSEYGETIIKNWLEL
ncbi:anthranilate synthase component II [Aurantibacillus circumpalustris]|uniref:anthranilate synthase component II n=1 Tax=Aurantibacillus circumpalustris TaxID=3036359 RepID=UPI00295B5E70|nr:aminodeoxychorismate/anthranilate synthase component II [Aurantibacillus circumpalustris]